MVGAHFFEYSLGALAGIIVFTMIMLAGYSANLYTNDKDLSINTGLLILFIILASLVGCATAFYARKLARRYSSLFIGAWMAGAISIMLLTLFGADGKLKLILALIAFVAGGYVGREYRGELRVFGTAITGAFMVSYGLGSYIGGFPTLSTDLNFEKNHQDISINVEEASSLKFIGYVVLMIVLTVVGIAYQNQFSLDDDDEDES